MATFRFDLKDLERGLNNLETKTEVMIKMKADIGAVMFQNYAKDHRPWTDRTGHARQRLVGWVEKITNGLRINISHGVKYGVYLELCNGKRYAILKPTVTAKSAEVLKLFKGMIERVENE